MNELERAEEFHGHLGRTVVGCVGQARSTRGCAEYFGVRVRGRALRPRLVPGGWVPTGHGRDHGKAVWW